MEAVDTGTHGSNADFESYDRLINNPKKNASAPNQVLYLHSISFHSLSRSVLFFFIRLPKKKHGISLRIKRTDLARVPLNLELDSTRLDF